MLPNTDRFSVTKSQNERRGEERTQEDSDDTNHQNLVQKLMALAIDKARSGMLDEAADHFHQVSRICREKGDYRNLALSLQAQVIYIFYYRGEFSLALSKLEEAILLNNLTGSDDWVSLFLRAAIYQTLGDRANCTEVLDQLLPQVRNSDHVSAAYLFIWARLSLDDEEVNRAEECLHLGFHAANQVPDLDLHLMFQVEYSRYYRMIGEPASALSWADDALRIARQDRSPYMVAKALMERAQARWQMEDFPNADLDLSDAIHILRNLRAAHELAYALYIRALWYHHSGQPEAPAYWVEAAIATLRGGYLTILQKQQADAFPLIAHYLRSREPQSQEAAEKILDQLARVPPPPLRVTTLGQFVVWIGNRKIPDQTWSKRKAGELFRFLLLQPNRTALRDAIIDALWPDRMMEKPTDVLHQSTSALRHALEPDLPDKFPSRYMKVEGESITLTLPSSSSIDFEQFENFLPAAMNSMNIDHLKEAIRLYNGVLFPSDLYCDWSAEKREALQELYKLGLLRLAKALLEQNQFFATIPYCQQVLKMDPWSEDAVLMLMKSYIALGEAPRAYQTYQKLEKTLQNELNIDPRKDLQTLARSLTRR